MRIVVISTGLNAPTADRCRFSVREQDRPDGCTLEHHYIEAGEQTVPRPNALENRYNIVQSLDPMDIVAEVDGDDWLAHRGVIRTLAAAYLNPHIWCSFGSYAEATKPTERMPWVRPYNPGEDFRTSDWRGSHLKTYRAALFQKVKRESFLGPSGGFCEHVHDMVTMLPMFEMAGPEHILFVPDILYIYNKGTSWEWRATVAERAYERKCKAFLKAQPPYERIGSL